MIVLRAALRYMGEIRHPVSTDVVVTPHSINQCTPHFRGVFHKVT